MLTGLLMWTSKPTSRLRGTSVSRALSARSGHPHSGHRKTQANFALVTKKAFVRWVVRSTRRNVIPDRQERARSIAQSRRHAGEQPNYHFGVRPALGRLTRRATQSDCLRVKDSHVLTRLGLRAASAVALSRTSKTTRHSLGGGAYASSIAMFGSRATLHELREGLRQRRCVRQDVEHPAAFERRADDPLVKFG